MSEPAEFQLSPQDPMSNRTPRVPWYLVTNQLNLMFMFAAGLVTGPKGFGRKYYLDPLSIAPGWVPLFRDLIPAGALAQATAEAKHLEVVAATVDLSALRGPVQAIDNEGQLKVLLWPDEESGDERMLFVPAPLPAGWVKDILLPSKEASVAFREQAADYANVSIAAYKQQVKARLFQSGAGSAWPPAGPVPSGRDQPLHQISAVGAVQALVVGLGNRGTALIKAARRLADPGDTGAEHGDDPLLQAVVQWARGATPTDADEVQARILGRLLAAVVRAKAEADDVTGTGCAPDTRQAVLDTLDDECQHLVEPKWQEALTRLTHDLKGLLGLGDATLSELLKRHTRPFSRGLILFFLRDHSDELLVLVEKQGLLTDQDLVVAAALYGARDGWMGLPQALKDYPGLSAATTHRMAVMAQQAQGSELDLGSAPPRVRPLLELLDPGTSGWSRYQLDGAVCLARGMKWQAVLKTRISLGKGNYRLQVDSRGVHLLFDGDVKAVQTDVDRDLLFQSLAKVAIPPKIEAEVRSKLKS